MKKETTYSVRTKRENELIFQEIRYPTEKICNIREYKELILKVAIDQKDLIEKEPNGTSLELKLILTKENKSK